MQEKNLHSVEIILERLRSVHNLKNTGKALAEFLGISDKAISAWKARESLDFALVIEKSNGVNLNWLFSGYGEMFIDTKAGKELRRNFMKTPSLELNELMNSKKPKDDESVEFDENMIASSPIAGIPKIPQTSETILPEQLSEIENDIKQVLLKIQSMMK